MIRSKITVVDDINNADVINEIDIDAIKNEVNQYVPTIQEFIDNSGLPSCH